MYEFQNFSKLKPIILNEKNEKKNYFNFINNNNFFFIFNSKGKFVLSKRI
jgi:hypothetical protein